MFSLASVDPTSLPPRHGLWIGGWRLRWHLCWWWWWVGGHGQAKDGCIYSYFCVSDNIASHSYWKPPTPAQAKVIQQLPRDLFSLHSWIPNPRFSQQDRRWGWGENQWLVTNCSLRPFYNSRLLAFNPHTSRKNPSTPTPALGSQTWLVNAEVGKGERQKVRQQGTSKQDLWGAGGSGCHRSWGRARD